MEVPEIRMTIIRVFWFFNFEDLLVIRNHFRNGGHWQQSVGYERKRGAFGGIILKVIDWRRWHASEKRGMGQVWRRGTVAHAML